MSEDCNNEFLALWEAAPIAVVVTDASGQIVFSNRRAEVLFQYDRREMMGQTLEILLPAEFEAIHTRHRQEYFAHPRARPMGLGMDLVGRRKDGTEFPVEVGLSHVTIAGEPLAMSFITDITPRVRAAEALRRHTSELESMVAARTAEIERRRRVAEGLHDILTILNTARPLSEILDFIVDQASRLLLPDAVAIFRQDGPHGLAQLEASRHLYDEEDAPETEPRATDPALLQGEAIGLGDQTVVETRTSIARKGRFRSVLAVPLNVKGEVYGSICLYYRLARTFSAEEKDLAISFADQAALAIENARLREQVERSAVAAERSRLARELHDSVTQTLFSTSLIAEVLPQLWKKAPREGQRRLAELRELTRGALAEMRSLLLELRPSALADADLGDLLRQLAEATTGRARLPVHTEIRGKGSLPAEVKIAFYRIVQEALNNVARHARASEARVGLTYQSDRAVLTVQDDGRGFDPSHRAPTHLGLNIMRERADAIGARVSIVSAPGEGTKIGVEWRAGPPAQPD